jgi:hypothetical protein
VVGEEKVSLCTTLSASEKKTFWAARPAEADMRRHLLKLFEVQDPRREVEWCGLVSLRPLLGTGGGIRRARVSQA